MIGTRFGNFRIVEFLGRGRMGAVYLAEDEALLRPTAVKVLDWAMPSAGGDDPVQWFLAEARNVARINHPNVIQIYGAARHGNHCCIAMEYVDGSSLDKIVAATGPLSSSRATEVVHAVASALAAAHASGVIHLDVKPANIMVARNGAVKLGDFGMAVGPRATAGRTSLAVGTPYFTAPEIWSGQPAGPSADLYSLGATYYFLLTGRQMFPSGSADELRRRHLDEPPPDPREVDPRIPAEHVALFRRLVAKQPVDRFASAEQFCGAVADLEQRSPATSTGDPRQDGFVAARGVLRDHFQLRYIPFWDAPATACPYLGEPFASLATAVVTRLARPDAGHVVLRGPAGSGRTMLCRRVADALKGQRPSIHLEFDAADPYPQPLQDLRCALGRDDGGSFDDCLAALELARPIVIFDGSLPVAVIRSDLVPLVYAARNRTSYSVVFVGDRDLEPQLNAAGVPGGWVSFAVVPLQPLEARAYIRAWLESAVLPGAAPPMFTPDAALIVGQMSAGELSRLNDHAYNALCVAARGQARIVDSWHVWAAADLSRRLADPSEVPEHLVRRPEPWPSSEVVDVVNQARVEIGWENRRG